MQVCNPTETSALGGELSRGQYTVDCGTMHALEKRQWMGLHAQWMCLPDNQSSEIPLLESPHGILPLLLAHLPAQLTAPHAMRRQLEDCVLQQQLELVNQAMPCPAKATHSSAPTGFGGPAKATHSSEPTGFGGPHPWPGIRHISPILICFQSGCQRWHVIPPAAEHPYETNTRLCGR